MRLWGRAAAIAGVCALALSLTACGLYRTDTSINLTPTPTHANLLHDPAFEQGADEWASNPQGALSLGRVPGRDGGHAATLDSTGGAAQISQTVAPPDFPDFVSGYYRVPRWSAGTSARFLAFSVTMHGGQFEDGLAQHTVHFEIGGMAAAPDSMPPGEAYVFLSRAAPVTNSWQYFGYPVKTAFTAAFGPVPPTWDSVDVAFQAQTGAVAGDAASFDDLYAGPQLENPNRPGG